MPSPRAIERLITYRPILRKLLSSGVKYVSSNQLGQAAGCTAHTVRSDLRLVKYCGRPGCGYQVPRLLESIGALLDSPVPEPVVLVGVGALGRAVVGYLADGRSRISVAGVFDRSPSKVGRRIRGHYCYPLKRLKPLVMKMGIQLGVITVPGEEAQGVADLLVDAGVRGLMNFAPVGLSVSPGVFVENIDMMVALAKLSYFVRSGDRAS